MKLYRYLTAVFFSLFALNLLAEDETDRISLKQLVRFMAEHKEIHATFEEKKYIKGVNAPIESSGELVFVAPSTMIRNTLHPKPEMFKMAGNTITMERQGKTRSLYIDDYPEISLHFEGMRALLAGDVERLTYLYAVKLTGTLSDWKLALSPFQRDTMLETLNLNGSRGIVKTVEVRLKDGDYSIMSVSKKDSQD